MSFFDKQIVMPFSQRRVSVKVALVHIAYWVLITGFFTYEKRYLIYKASMPYYLSCVVGRITMLVIIAYLNHNVFLPRFLMKRRYWGYVGCVLLSILIYLIVQSFYDYYLYGFVIGPMRNSNWVETLSYNFFSTLWYLSLMLALKLSMDWYEQQQLLQKILVEKLRAELSFLRAQVNPHFLFNILNNLYALTLKKSDMAPEVVLKLSEMMEYMLYHSDENTVSLEKEVGYLNSYIELEKIRYGNQPEISLEIEGEMAGKQIAPLLLLPLIENAFKHGLSQQSNQGWMHGKISVTDTGLKLLVENSKPVTASQKQVGGIGLENLKKRLSLLYPGNFELKIENEKDSFRARMDVNLSNVITS